MYVYSYVCMYVCMYAFMYVTLCMHMFMQIMMQSKEGNMCVLSELIFQSDELVCHPQKADDCGWSMHAADNKYQVIH